VSEGDGLARRILETVEILSAPPGGILLGPAEPVSLDRLIFDQGSDCMDSRPVLRPSDEPFLASVGENVAQALDLGGLLMTDDDGPVPARPDPVRPVDEPAHLPRQVGVQIAHEVGQLAGVFDVQQQVVMGGEKRVGADRDGIQPERSSKDAEDDLVQRRAGPQEVTAVDGAAGDLDEGPAFGDET